MKYAIKEAQHGRLLNWAGKMQQGQFVDTGNFTRFEKREEAQAVLDLFHEADQVSIVPANG